MKGRGQNAVYAQESPSPYIARAGIGKLGGGGNQSAAGAQIPDTSLEDTVKALCASIDAYLENG